MGDQTSGSSSPIGRAIIRIVMEWMIWLPVWMVLTTNMRAAGKFGMVAAVLFFFALGLLLHRFPTVWRRISMLAIFIALLAAGISLYTRELPIFIWMGILLWRGRYLKLRPMHYGLAFGICCAVMIVTSRNDVWADDRLIFILMAIVWVAVWFVALNEILIEQAGLHNGIVTSRVRQANRNYLYIFLAIGLLVIALTASYGQQLLTPKQAVVNPDNSWIDPNNFIQPPREMEKPEWMEEEEPGKPSVIWDILFWILSVVVVCAAFWFARLFWNNRTWTWRGFLKSIREWFLREKKAEKLPYVEERRSLAKEKKKGSSLIDSLFRRRNRGADWERLSNPEKVRRLYEEVVLAGIEQGYEFQASHTPSETLEGIERWRTSRRASDDEKLISYWNRLLSIKSVLLELYEKAKYGPHEISAQEVEGLKERYPDRKGFK